MKHSLFPEVGQYALRAHNVNEYMSKMYMLHTCWFWINTATLFLCKHGSTFICFCFNITGERVENKQFLNRSFVLAGAIMLVICICLYCSLPKMASWQTVSNTCEWGQRHIGQQMGPRPDTGRQTDFCHLCWEGIILTDPKAITEEHHTAKTQLVLKQI